MCLYGGEAEWNPRALFPQESSCKEMSEKLSKFYGVQTKKLPRFPKCTYCLRKGNHQDNGDDEFSCSFEGQICVNIYLVSITFLTIL